LTSKKLPRLEVTADTTRCTRQAAGICKTNHAMR
jgi:hypothetical protein